MRVTLETVEREYEWVRERAPRIAAVSNDVRARLADAFGVAVDDVTVAGCERVVDETFADGDRAVNVAGMTAILRELDVDGDYPGFVVDEVLGRELAATIAGEQPLRMLAEATFHYADVHTHGDGETTPGVEDGDVAAGVDDLDAALAAGVQTRLPGWEWTADASPFAVATAVERAGE
jgi:hypothetical protein